MAMVDASMREAMGHTPEAVRILSKKLERSAREDDTSEAEAAAAAVLQPEEARQKVGQEKISVDACVDMSADVCTDMCVGMCVDMYAHVC